MLQQAEPAQSQHRAASTSLTRFSPRPELTKDLKAMMEALNKVWEEAGGSSAEGAGRLGGWGGTKCQLAGGAVWRKTCKLSIPRLLKRRKTACRRSSCLSLRSWSQRILTSDLLPCGEGLPVPIAVKVLFLLISPSLFNWSFHRKNHEPASLTLRWKERQLCALSRARLDGPPDRYDAEMEIWRPKWDAYRKTDSYKEFCIEKQDCLSSD